jgi:hypothetical protein
MTGTGASAVAALTATSLKSLIALSAAGELDMTAYNNVISFGAVPSVGAGKSSGWVGGFSLFAATIDPSTQSGSYGFAWQAGINDGWTRVFMTRMDFNASTGSAAAKGFFGYGEDFLKGETASDFGSLKGMICNWAGPGNRKTALPRFQYQSLKLSTTTGQWEPAASGNWSKTEFAPTNSCNTSSAMGFDKTYDAAGTYGATPTGPADSSATGVAIASAISANASVLSAGSSFTNDLDTLDSGTTTVQGTLQNRGYSKPCLFGGSCASSSASGSGSGSGSGTGSGDGGG